MTIILYFSKFKINNNIRQKKKRKIYKYDSADWDKINKYFKTIPWKILFYNMENIEEMVNFLEDEIERMMNKYIPTFTLSNKKQKKPWMNYEIIKCIRIKKRYITRYNKNKTEENKYQCKLITNLLNTLIKESKDKYYQKLQDNITTCKYNSKYFWYNCNKLLGRKISIRIGDIIQNNIIYKNDQAKCKLFGYYFASQVNGEGHYNTDINYNEIPTKNTQFNFHYITNTEIENIVKYIKIDTAN